MHRLILSFSFALLMGCFFSGCGNKSEQQASSSEEVADSLALAVADSLAAAREDSLALRVALLPTANCLPFFYAQEKGIYDTLNLSLRIKLFKAALDCDTAYIGGSAHGGVTDTVRLRFLRERGTALSPQLTLRSRLAIVGSRLLDLKRVEDLRGRTVVGERFSTSQLLINRTLAQHRVKEEEYFTPQISSQPLRATMLNNDQIDAALLDEPFLTVAEKSGNKVLVAVDDRWAGYTCLAFADSLLHDSLRSAQINLLLRGYKLAAAELNAQGVNRTCRRVMVDKFGVPENVVGSVKLPKYE